MTTPRALLDAAERLLEEIQPSTRAEQVHARVAVAAELRKLAKAELLLTQAQEQRHD